MIIDWDDAGWGDPAMDLVSLPLRVVDHVLAGYRSVMPLDGDDTAVFTGKRSDYQITVVDGKTTVITLRVLKLIFVDGVPPTAMGVS